MTDADFHQAIVQLITRTRDRHLSFWGNSPLGFSAVLPFTIERCWEGSQAQYVVTKISFAFGFAPKHLRIGALVTHWNAIPIERFVRLNANAFDGGNEAASLARSLAFLTHRSLSQFAVPLEAWVDLRFVVQGVENEERFLWQGFDVTQTPPTPGVGRNLTGFGGDLELLHLHHARRARFAPQSFDAPPAPSPAPPPPGVPQIVGRDPHGNFDYGSVTTEHGTFGYVRLWAFGAAGPDDIANSFAAALSELPRNGLIIDMRGNSGGRITAGERVLQLFSPERVTPTRFQFRVTPATMDMVRATPEFGRWRRSFEEAFATGEPYTQGFPIEGTDDDVNTMGQVYFGPVVLISDALAFSTADMFAAGFLDHEIGRVICTDENMGAAGGNNWTWEVVRLFTPDFPLDPSLKSAFDTGVISPEVREAFNRQGVSLSAQATLSPPQPEFDGAAWRIIDGVLIHVVRDLSWMSDHLQVYLHQGRRGLADMPRTAGLGLTIRRCMRVRRSEGRLLEDLGIRPDVMYRMTFRDITEQNQDLLTRASLELSHMPRFDLAVDVVQGAERHTLVCRTVRLTSLEVFEGQHHVTAASSSDGAPTELTVRRGIGRVEVRGMSGDVVVARTLVSLPV
jgi:peptidase S41-like protein